MEYTLSSKGVALGHTAFELPTGKTWSLSGFFHPTAALATVGAPLLAMADEFATLPDAMRHVVPSPDELATLPPLERAHRIQAALRADPGTRRRVDLLKAVEALALELHDEHGMLLPTRSVFLAPFPPPAALPPDVTAAAARNEFRQDLAESGVGVTNLMIVVERPIAEAGAA